MLWYLLNYKSGNEVFYNPSYLEKLLVKFHKIPGRGFFYISKGTFVRAINELGYNNIIDNLIAENEQILNRRIAQDSDRFNLFFNAIIILFFTTFITNYKIFLNFIFTNLVFQKVFLVFIYIVSIIVIAFFNRANVLHELDREYQFHLILNSALYQIKNEEECKDK